MHPRIADRIAKNVSKVKRQESLDDAARLLERLKLRQSDAEQVRERLLFWKDKPV